MEEKDLTPIINRCLDGDPDAKEALVRESMGLVYNNCRYILGPDNAEDASQEILFTMLTQLDRLKDPAAFRGWLKTMTVHYCQNQLRHDRRHSKDVSLEGDEDHSIPDTFEDLDDQTVPDKALDNDETRTMIVDLIKALPDAQRQCVLMFYYDEMSVRELAAVVGVSEGTIKSRLNYARKAIKEGVDKYDAQGLRLYSFSPLPFLLYFLQKDAMLGGLTSESSTALVQSVLAAHGAAGAAAAGAAGSAAGAAAGGCRHRHCPHALGSRTCAQTYAHAGPDA